MTLRLEQRIEEVLERLWTAREQGAPVARDVTRAALGFDPGAVVAEGEQRGWIARETGGLRLTPAGEVRASGVMRRHRLAERLFHDVLRVDSAAMEAAACELEHAHILSEEATDRICAFLGHPPTCPHDRPIPRGRCCDRLAEDLRPLVTPLGDGTVGANYRIVFIAARARARLDRLCALGMLPGTVLHLQQRRPALVVRVGETDVALEPDVAGDVFVVPC